MDNLIKRKVAANPCCIRCDEEVDTATHALFRCHVVEEIWVNTVFWSEMVKFWGMQCNDLIRWMFSRFSVSDFEYFCVILWSVWNNHNLLVHKGRH